MTTYIDITREEMDLLPFKNLEIISSIKHTPNGCHPSTYLVRFHVRGMEYINVRMHWMTFHKLLNIRGEFI